MTALAQLRTHRSHVGPDLTWEHTDEPVAIPCEREIGVMLECEMVRPPSSEGKRVLLVISPAQLVGLHRIIKDEMRRQRSTPMNRVPSRDS